MSIRKKIIQTVVYSTVIAMVPATLYGIYRVLDYSLAENWKYNHRDQLARIATTQKESAGYVCDFYQTVKTVADERPKEWEGFDWTVFKANCMEAGREP